MIANSHLSDRIGMLWCSLMHDSAKWPIHGHYECGLCGRKYEVPWDQTGSTVAVAGQRSPRRSLSSAVLPILVLMAAAAWPGHSAEVPTADAGPAAAAVLERFFASQGEASPWPLETMEIDASLPGLKKTGRLRAIRRLLPMGRPDYRVLEIAGDATVKSQVIVRYISADERAAELTASSVAVTPVNYKIHYAGAVLLGGRTAFAFRIVPRKKREGLVNGVLWVDGETGIAVRESGYLVKSPSIFLKRVNVTRENEYHDGAVQAKVTHISIETRLMGRAQLVIVERPSSDELSARGPAAGGQ